MVQVPRTLQFVTRGLDLTSYLEIGISLKLQIPAKSICPMITISLRWEFIWVYIAEEGIAQVGEGGGFGKASGIFDKRGESFQTLTLKHRIYLIFNSRLTHHLHPPK